jgi:hypothetical protein
MVRGEGRELLRCCWRGKRKKRRIEKILNLELWIIYREGERGSCCLHILYECLHMNYCRFVDL